MMVKFVSMKGSDRVARSPFYVALVQHERTLSEPEPIAETRDGLVKVMSVADDETGDTFTYGDTWSVRGEGFTGTAPGWAGGLRPARRV